MRSADDGDLDAVIRGWRDGADGGVGGARDDTADPLIHAVETEPRRRLASEPRRWLSRGSASRHRGLLALFRGGLLAAAARDEQHGQPRDDSSDCAYEEGDRECGVLGQPVGEDVRGDDGAGDLRPDGGADVAHDRVDAGGFAGLVLVDRADDEVGDRGEGGADADEDIAILQLMLGLVIDAAQDVEPELWRRYLGIVFQGLRANPGPPAPLAPPALSAERMDEVVVASWNARRRG